MEPSSAAQRRQRQRSTARRVILDATEALMLERGGDDFPIRSLASRCGYTAPTIYHYFGDKQGLVDALLEERFGRLHDRLRRVEQVDDPVENLRRMSHTLLDFGLRNPALYRLLLSASGDGRGRIPPAWEKSQALLSAALFELGDGGRLLPRDPDAAVQTVWAMLHGLTALRVGRPQFAWSPDLTDVAVETLLRGLIRPAGLVRKS